MKLSWGVSKNVKKKIVGSGILSRYLWAAKPLSRRAYILYNTPTILLFNTKSARHGQNQEKQKTPTTESNVFFLKIFFEGKY